jgi:S1-C subfamily serine protease
MIRVRHLQNSSLAPTEQQFAKHAVRIGRKPDCDVRFDPAKDLAVSGDHAELHERDGRLFLVDLGSRNGTFVNGVRIAGEFELSDSDVVRLGSAGPEMSCQFTRSAAVETVRETAPAKQGIGAQTMARAIHVATEEERSKSRKSLAIVALAVVVLMAGGFAWYQWQNEQIQQDVELTRTQSEQARLDAERARQDAEEARGRISKVDSKVDAAQQETSQLRKETAEARRVADEARAKMDSALEGALAQHEQELAALKSQLSSGEVRVSELIVELEARDQELRDISLRQDLTEGARKELEAQTQQRLAELQQELEQSQDELRKETRAAADDWAELVGRYRESIFLCVMETKPDAQNMVSTGIGTAFVIREDGLLATNSHVADMFVDTSNLSFFGVIQNSTGNSFDIKEVKLHAKYAGPASPDVALIRVETQGYVFTPIPLASEEKLRALRIGVQLGTLGYPGELQASYFQMNEETKQFVSAEATFKDGWIGRMTDFERSRTDFEHSWYIQHSASTSGGTSGSPMFTRDGVVVALNNSGIDYMVQVTKRGGGGEDVVRTPSAAEIGGAIRVDLLQELLRDSGW